MKLLCPNCQSALDALNEGYYCLACQETWSDDDVFPARDKSDKKKNVNGIPWEKPLAPKTKQLKLFDE